MQTHRRTPSWPPLLCVALLLAGQLVPRASEAQMQQPFQVIVHPRTPVVEVDRETLARIFLKRSTRWSSELAVLPVDQRQSAAVRSQFSLAVLRRPSAAIRNYWQQAIFSGRDVPPPELEDDAAVVRYVLSHPGAVGYVSASAPIGGARVLRIRWD